MDWGGDVGDRGQQFPGDGADRAVRGERDPGLAAGAQLGDGLVGAQVEGDD